MRLTDDNDGGYDDSNDIEYDGGGRDKRNIRENSFIKE